MSDNLQRAVESNESEVAVKLRERQAMPPAAWKAGSVWTDTDGEVTTEPSNVPITHWDDILTHLGYDPELYEIIEPVKVTSWDVQTATGKEQLWSYKAGIRSRATEKLSYDDLVKEIKRHRPLKPDSLPDGDAWFVVNLADWQLGKDDGYGVEGTVKAIVQMIDDVERRIRDLRLLGRNIGNLLIMGLGDMIEGCDGFYAQQTFRVELNRREQIRLCRRLLRDCIARWSKLFKVVKVSAVGGNHGENRKDGRLYTTPSDNDDLAVFEIVAEVLAENPKAYGHVEFHIPEGEQAVTFNLDGVIVGFAHGHISKGGGKPQDRIKTWWQEQTFGHQPVGEASILVTGHYHHFSVIEYGKKIHIQCPTMDGGSEYYRDLTGQESRPGTLTFVIDGNYKGGYRDAEIL